MPKAKGARGKIQDHLSGSDIMLPPDKTPTLKDIGVERHESSRYQKAKEMPKAKGGQPFQNKPTSNMMLPVEPTLKDIGIEKHESSCGIFCFGAILPSLRLLLNCLTVLSEYVTGGKIVSAKPPPFYQKLRKLNLVDKYGTARLKKAVEKEKIDLDTASKIASIDDKDTQRRLVSMAKTKTSTGILARNIRGGRRHLPPVYVSIKPLTWRKYANSKMIFG